MSRLFRLFKHPRQNKRGHVLTVMLIMLTISLVMLAAMLDMTFNETTASGRNNQYNAASGAAEAAIEKVVSQMNRDFVNQSVNADLTAYSDLVPDQTDWPVQYQFQNLAGSASQTDVLSLGPSVVTNLDSTYAGLYGLVTPFSVSSRATPLSGQILANKLSATVSTSLQLASIPIFQFAIFYNQDLEINPGRDMAVTGKVHSNGKIYAGPNSGVNLEFQDNVTAVSTIINSRAPLDPSYGGGVAVPTYDAAHTPNVNPLNMPIGTNNNPIAVHEILDVPASGESSSSLISKLRLYNNADLIFSNSDNGLTVMAGGWDGFVVLVKDVTNTATPFYSFVTNATFTDFREAKQVIATEIDIAKFNLWRTNAVPSARGGYNFNELAKSAHVHGMNSIYVVDSRTAGSSLKAVRVTHGDALPSDGLTVVTLWPIYVKGHYNLNNGTDQTVGQTDTSHTKPAALIGDSITILSSAWQDSYVSTTTRTPADTTVNAAFLAGIVPTVSGHYSGGVENYPRLLESWPGHTLTYNGSMVVMFPSYYATGYWQPTGHYYDAPTRRWAFDTNFRQQPLLPPLTPQVKTLIRTKWETLSASATSP